jgi:cobaltochelatase CobS
MLTKTDLPFLSDELFRLSLGAEGRSRLRTAIKQHSGWDALRAARSLDIASMDATTLKRAGVALGLDVAAIVQGSPAPKGFDIDLTPAPTPVPTVINTTLTTPETTPVQPTPVSNDVGAQLAALIASLAGQSVNAAQVAEIARTEVERALANGPVLKIEVRQGDELKGKVEGRQHKDFPKLLKMAAARDTKGNHLNIWLAGPAGSGKTTAAEKVAEAMGVPFWFNGALCMPHELLGFVDAAGNYHSTPFRRAFEEGGVYLFDEIDVSENAVLLAVNAALANGVCAFPDGKIVARHPDLVVMAGANTWGQGATADYVGRAKIDAAFIDRFVCLSWGYDEELERAISGNADWALHVQRIRDKAKAAGLKVVISPRATVNGAALVAQGFTFAEASEMTILAKLSPEQRKMLT